MGFKDYFSSQSGEYARIRPDYPGSLFEIIASKAPGQSMAVDVGCGSGQAAMGLSELFNTVIAFDPSAKQIQNAIPCENVHYGVARVEALPVKNHLADVITVAQALHWFHLPEFYAEVRRILKPGGLLAAWIYNIMTISPEVDAVVDGFYKNIVGPYWPPERRLIEENYATLPFDFDRVETCALLMEKRWSQHKLMDMLHTWSATQRYKEAKGADPVALINAALKKAWGAEETRIVRWPVTLKMGRV
ncbi:MAG: methyltransferase domain-containing protein [Nitrospinae bacterium]|nr:methyltransferase domain-containing protein [Nitrospinota bacterium]